jgi:phosphoribosylglycinamide formyltransferase-1
MSGLKIMKRIVILISGRGSNMQAIVNACEQEQWPAKIVAVGSNQPQAAGLAWAQQKGLNTLALDHRQYADRADFDAALLDACQAYEPDYVVLAGFVRVLGEAFVNHFAGRLINIHPSLLPAFPCLHTHRRELQAGVKWAGASVHFVTPELDHGPIIAQAAVPVLANDTEASLAARVLEIEHPMLVQCVRWLVQGCVYLEGDHVVQINGEPQYYLHGFAGYARAHEGAVHAS